MGPLLDDLTGVHDQNQIGMADRRQTMGDDEARAIAAQRPIACCTLGAVSTELVASSRISTLGRPRNAGAASSLIRDVQRSRP